MPQQEQLTTIKLSGQLGKKFGRVHEFYVRSPAEAVRALCSQLEGFQEYLMDERDERQYKVFVKEQRIDPKEQLHELSGTKEIRIAPVVQANKRGGLFQVIMGAVLIALAFTPIGAIALGAKMTVGSVLFGMGAGMVLGGIAQLLSPQPRMDSYDAPENSPNKNFNGVVNTIGSGGHPVPLAYGEIVCGSAIISAGMYASDINH